MRSYFSRKNNFNIISLDASCTAVKNFFTLKMFSLKSLICNCNWISLYTDNRHSSKLTVYELKLSDWSFNFLIKNWQITFNWQASSVSSTWNNHLFDFAWVSHCIFISDEIASCISSSLFWFLFILILSKVRMFTELFLFLYVNLTASDSDLYSSSDLSLNLNLSSDLCLNSRMFNSWYMQLLSNYFLHISNIDL